MASRSFKSSFTIALLRFTALFPLSFLRSLGNLLGRILWYTAESTRRVTETNLAICYPEMPPQDREQLAKQSICQLCQMALELGPVWFWSPEKILAHVHSVRGKELMDAALAEGRGVILLAPHLGNWEAFGVYLGKHYPITCLYRPPKMEELGDIVRAARERCGTGVVPTDAGGVRALLKTLKRGEVTGILPDQEPDRSGGEFAPFFGKEALTMGLISNLAARTGAAVINGYALRVGSGYELVFEPADPAIASMDQREALSALNRSVEQCVSAAPAQYQWEYKRFKTRPEGEQRLYKKAK